MGDIKKIHLNREHFLAQQAPTLLGRILPILLIISFAFTSFYNTSRNLSASVLALFENSQSLVIFVEVAFIGLIEYFVYVLIMWLYKTILKTRPYFALVGERDFQETFGICYVVRNVIVGAVGLLQFYYPYLALYMSLFAMIMTFISINVTYVFLSRKMEIMFRHFYYKLLLLPWFVWHAITAVFAIIFGGTIL